MKMNTFIRLTVITVLVLGFNTVPFALAADDYFQSASTITSTRARQSRDRGQAVERKSWTSLFSKDSSAPAKASAKSAFSEMETASIAYPTGSVSSSSLLLEKMYPSVVRTGKPYEYTIQVTNLTDLSLNDVNISEVIPDGFEVIGAQPDITNRSGDNVNWDLGTLSPNAVRTILIKGKAKSKQALPCCTSAEYGLPALCSSMSVVEPAISLTMTTREEATMCDRIPLQYTVKNTGDSLLPDVELSSILPDGLTNLDGGSQIMLQVGDLSAGESKVLTAYAQAQETGKFSLDGNASSLDISAAAQTDSILITQPVFELDIDTDRAKQYVGRSVEYEITVKNSGNAQAASTILEASVPTTAKIQDAKSGGQISGRTARWNLGTIPSGDSQTFTMAVQGLAAGQTLAKAQINAVCAAPVQEMASAEFQGIPALLLEVIDLEDPIAVGEDEIYVIKVTNQGSADATNIKITAMLEGMEYVSGTGETSGAFSGNTVTFSPVRALAPGQEAKWNVQVKGETEGDLRFKVAMDSDQLTRSVEESESTFVY